MLCILLKLLTRSFLRSQYTNSTRRDTLICFSRIDRLCQERRSEVVVYCALCSVKSRAFRQLWTQLIFALGDIVYVSDILYGLLM